MNRRRGFGLRSILLAISAITVFYFWACGRHGYSRGEARAYTAVRHIHLLTDAQSLYYSSLGEYAKQVEIPHRVIRPERWYTFTMTATAHAYQIVAIPNLPEEQGATNLYSDETQVIRESNGPGPADVHSKELR